MTDTKSLRNACIATFLLLVALAVTAPLATADHCHEGCHPDVELQVTGTEVPPYLDPFNDDERPIYWGWTTVDVLFESECDCFIEGARIDYEVVEDFHPTGQSAGIESTQLDGDTWLVHALDWDVYRVTFTVFVYCEDGSFYEYSTTWLQRN